MDGPRRSREMALGRINQLVDVMGREWVDIQIARHREFQLSNTPAGFWSHRLPTLSPLIPALAEWWQPRGLPRQNPLGYWYGDPIIFLAEIAEQVSLFQDFWDNLPNGRGRHNLGAHLLRKPARFASFQHELTVATHFALQDCTSVTPAFFDPDATPGQPDIIVDRAGSKFAISCKCRSPVEALEMPFDIFQYMVGILIRRIQDSGNSARCFVEVASRLNKRQIDEIAERLSRLILGRVAMPYPAVYPAYSIRVEPMTRFRGFTDAEVRRLANRTPGKHFVAIAGVNLNDITGRYMNVGVVSVSGRKPFTLLPWIRKTALEAAYEGPQGIPTVLALHVLGNVDFEAVMRKPQSARKLKLALQPTFDRFSQVKQIVLSSYNEAYERKGEKVTPRMQVIEFDNPNAGKSG